MTGCEEGAPATRRGDTVVVLLLRNDMLPLFALFRSFAGKFVFQAERARAAAVDPEAVAASIAAALAADDPEDPVCIFRVTNLYSNNQCTFGRWKRRSGNQTRQTQIPLTLMNLRCSLTPILPPLLHLLPPLQ